jgi:hypothetical protein
MIPVASVRPLPSIPTGRDGGQGALSSQAGTQTAHCKAMEPMIAEVARRASLPKDEVQRSAPVPPAGRQARGAETAQFCSSQ